MRLGALCEHLKEMTKKQFYVDDAFLIQNGVNASGPFDFDGSHLTITAEPASAALEELTGLPYSSRID